MSTTADPTSTAPTSPLPTAPTSSASTVGMTVTGRPGTVGGVALVTEDLYRDIHKAIRVELFSITSGAGRLDPSDRAGRVALAHHLRSVVDLLVSHAEHEDGAIQPALEAHLPVLAEKVEHDHESLEARMDDLLDMAGEAVDAPPREQRGRVHHLYLELGSFTSDYLRHQDLEERVIMPALEDRLGVDAVVAIHQAIVSNIPPQEMAATLALMLPAMNHEDRVDLLGGMQANAPAEVFEGVWSLAGSVLESADRSKLARALSV